jgi:hypothetical protein
MLLGFSASGACPKLIHFTAESGVYKPGGFFESDSSMWSRFNPALPWTSMRS